MIAGDGDRRPDADGVYRDAMGVPYVPRPLPPQPTKSLLNGKLKYTNSSSTDVEKTIARVRREQRKAAVDAQGHDDGGVVMFPTIKRGR